MVDCRLCRYAYKIWDSELSDASTGRDRFKLVCMKREIFIDQKYIPIDPCEDYVDVDWDISGNGDL